MAVNYLSVCSGIEAASLAWKPLGWQAVAFSEIEPFPCALLAYRYPEVRNLGDMMQYETWRLPSGSVDVLVGGTPCQSFSVAGRRGGVADPRGQLMFSFLEIAERIRPRWVVWENVPGVLSSSRGRDFGAFLGAMGNLGYGWAYRVLDARWFGVPQRRRRVFVVGHLGDGRRAAKVLFESESVCRDLEKSSRARQSAGPTLESRTRSGGVSTDFACNGGVIAMCLNAGAARWNDIESETFVVPTLSGEGHGGGNHNEFKFLASVRRGVRRLTPTEWERLMGMPDGYTAIPYRGKPAKDAPRYRAIGNSMAVPVMRWIGERIGNAE